MAISTIVALVSALMGLNAALPSSLIQMSLRMSSSTGHLSPPATIASLNARQRSEISRFGSPIENRVPSMCWIRPGPTTSVEQYTTQPTARSRGRVSVTTPPGSTDSIRWSTYGPVRPWKYHHGMPFCAAITVVVSCINGLIRAPHDA